MSDHDDFDEDASHRTFTAPYSPHHPIPTVQRYAERRQHWQELDNASGATPDEGEARDESTLDKLKSRLHGNTASKDETPEQKGHKEPYSSQNRNLEQPAGDNEQSESPAPDGSDRADNNNGPREGEKSAGDEPNPRQKRKNMKHSKRDHAGREVTDPVTHLPVTIHDLTEKELNNAPENEPPSGSGPRTSSGFSTISKSDSQLQREEDEERAQHRGMEKLFPPPNFAVVKGEIIKTYNLAITVGLGSTIGLLLVVLLMNHLIGGGASLASHNGPQTSWLRLLLTFSLVLVFGLGLGSGVVWGIQGWLKNRINDIWEDETWAAAKEQEQEQADSPTPESTQWLNSLLASVWPMINPDLFTSLADTLEDVMQASLPKAVRMISIEDLGQGSEAIRILGVRWLPTGAAAKSVSVDGRVKSTNENKDSDRTVPGQGEVDDNASPDSHEEHDSNTEKKDSKDESRDKEEEQENVAEGMEAEEGDFVNVEIAFSYRASSSGKGLKKKAKNAHLYMAFYLPAGIRFPVWVELRGIVGVMRMRLQLCPDPPFFSLCTLTLLGQPRADLSCVPLAKHGPNVMDLPFISSFVQSSIDAALAEYVAPKSLTLDLKDMLVGDDFKKDTNSRGVLMITIKRASGFKEGDGGIGGLKKGSSDPYVSVGWAKFGKPMWSTRIIITEMEPHWNETTFVLVGPDEVNAEERLRIQIWDSDRLDADDDLGRIEIDLKELMHNPQSQGKLWNREEGFIAMEADETMPGQLDWSVGYFPKTSIQRDQLARQTEDPDIKTFQQLKDKVSEETRRKLREATDRDESNEIDQQKAQDLKVREDALIISSPPPNDYPSGILSIQVHNITGLEFQALNKSRDPANTSDDAPEGSGDLPSSYCTIILNHQMIFNTRTKPKNSKPFFNASTERFIRDWRTAEVILSVRDSRVHENDPLIGMVHLPLDHAFRERSQINQMLPLVGGIGYGRVRVSMVFRSIQLQAPRELLGWDYGTVEIIGPITSKDISTQLQGLRLKLRTSISTGRVKMYSTNASTAEWKSKKDRRLCLAVRNRYSSCLVIEFRKNRMTIDQTPAFAILWLKDIPDNEDRIVSLAVWKGDLKRAEANCCKEMGEKMGNIDVPLKFWHGLGRQHKHLASKNPDLHNVFEVLDTANENQETKDSMAANDGGDNSDSSSDDDSTNERNGHDKHNQEDGRRGPIDQFREYRDHRQQLHRQQKGVMQWKGARTAQWMKTKVEHGKDHVAEQFQRKERTPGIETEV